MDGDSSREDGAMVTRTSMDHHQVTINLKEAGRVKDRDNGATVGTGGREMEEIRVGQKTWMIMTRRWDGEVGRDGFHLVKRLCTVQYVGTFDTLHKHSVSNLLSYTKVRESDRPISFQFSHFVLCAYAGPSLW